MVGWAQKYHTLASIKLMDCGIVLLPTPNFPMVSPILKYVRHLPSLIDLGTVRGNPSFSYWPYDKRALQVA